MAATNRSSRIAEENEPNSFVRFIKYFIPWKGDKSSEVVRKIIFFASVAVFAVSVDQLSGQLKKGGIKGGSEVQDVVQYEPKSDDNVKYEVVSGNADIDISDAAATKKPREVQQWAKDKELLERNPDVVGWIRIPGFKDYYDEEMIDFPVLRGKDNDDYLYKDLDRNYYESGSIFADAWCKIDEDGQSDNCTIFGHHMGVVGTNFTHLSEYEQGADFVREYPIIEFNSVYETGCQYAIVSCFMVNTEPEDDDGNTFEYIGYRDFNDEDYRFEDWYNEITKRSWYSSDIKCTEDDKYITLSTCSKLVEEGVRWVIVAKKLTPDDDIEAIKASYKDKDNSDIYFPEIWKDIYGNETVYKGWEF